MSGNHVEKTNPYSSVRRRKGAVRDEETVGEQKTPRNPYRSSDKTRRGLSKGGKIALIAVGTCLLYTSRCV